MDRDCIQWNPARGRIGPGTDFALQDDSTSPVGRSPGTALVTHAAAYNQDGGETDGADDGDVRASWRCRTMGMIQCKW